MIIFDGKQHIDCTISSHIYVSLNKQRCYNEIIIIDEVLFVDLCAAFSVAHVLLSVLVPQTGGQTEMEEVQPQSGTEPPPQEEPQGGDLSSDEAHLQTSALVLPSESLDQKETQMDVEEKGDSAAQLQAKPLWKPIPPLLPEPRSSSTSETRDQSCQTEEQLQQTSAGSHGHNTGG